MRALVLAVLVAACSGGGKAPPPPADAPPPTDAMAARPPVDAAPRADAAPPVDAAVVTRRKGRRAGQVCESATDLLSDPHRWPCAAGLTCCNPCGIQGCAWVCKDVGRHGCPTYP